MAADGKQVFGDEDALMGRPDILDRLARITDDLNSFGREQQNQFETLKREKSDQEKRYQDELAQKDVAIEKLQEELEQNETKYTDEIEQLKTDLEKREAEYKSSLEKLEDQHDHSVVDFQDKLKALEQDRSKRDETIETLQDQIAQLKKDLNNSKAERQSLQDRYKAEISERQDLQDKHNLLVTQMASLELQSADQKDLIKDLSAQLEATEKDKSTLQVELDKLKIENLAHLEATRKRAQDELDLKSLEFSHIRTQLEAEHDEELTRLRLERDESVANLNQHCQQLKRDLESIRAEFDDLRELLSTRTDELANSKLSVEKLEAQRGALNRELDSQRMQLEDLQHEIRQLQDLNSELKSRSQEVSKQNDMHVENLKQLRNTLRNVESSRTEIRKELNSCKISSQHLEQELRAAKTEAADLRASIHRGTERALQRDENERTIKLKVLDLEKEREGLIQDLSTIKKRLMDRESQLRQKSDSLSSLEAKVTRLQREIDRLEQHNKTMAEKFELQRTHLEHQLDQTNRSRSHTRESTLSNGGANSGVGSSSKSKHFTDMSTQIKEGIALLEEEQAKLQDAVEEMQVRVQDISTNSGSSKTDKLLLEAQQKAAKLLDAARDLSRSPSPTKANGHKSVATHTPTFNRNGISQTDDELSKFKTANKHESTTFFLPFNGSNGSISSILAHNNNYQSSPLRQPQRSNLQRPRSSSAPRNQESISSELRNGSGSRSKAQQFGDQKTSTPIHHQSRPAQRVSNPKNGSSMSLRGDENSHGNELYLLKKRLEY